MCSFFFSSGQEKFRSGMSGRSTDDRGMSGRRCVYLHFTRGFCSAPS